MHIKITRRPNGEAPEWVRDAWIGITLPADRQTKRTYRGLGVLSGPYKWSAQLWAMMRGQSFLVTGYAVQARLAVDLLARMDPAAAAWWLKNAADLVRGRRLFIFEAEVCEPQVDG